MRPFLPILLLLAGTAGAQSVPGACPSELDIKNIHTALSALVIPTKNASALKSELAKAELCRASGGRYTYEQWKRLENVLRGEP
jgi:hypothetical protein